MLYVNCSLSPCKNLPPRKPSSESKWLSLQNLSRIRSLLSADTVTTGVLASAAWVPSPPPCCPVSPRPDSSLVSTQRQRELFQTCPQLVPPLPFRVNSPVLTSASRTPLALLLARSSCTPGAPSLQLSPKLPNVLPCPGLCRALPCPGLHPGSLGSLRVCWMTSPPSHPHLLCLALSLLSSIVYSLISFFLCLLPVIFY